MEELNDKGNIISEGEMTGHTHKVIPQVKVMERLDGIRMFSGATNVTHEEHKTIHLINDDYFADNVKEYDYFREMERHVLD